MSSATYATRDISNALEVIERDIKAAKPLRRFISDYGAVVALIACYAYASSLRPSAGASDFLPLVVVLLSLHVVSEMRAQQQQKLLLHALREMQRVIEREATPDA